MHDHPYARAAQALEGTPFSAIHYVERTGSTNADAADVLGDERFAGRTFVAEHQTLGAGRKGRTWIARSGTSLLFTTILPRPIPSASLWSVPFWAALSVAAGLRECGVEAALHWPNDLLIGTRKVSGILCVSRVAGERAWAGIGVGINVRRQPGAERDIAPPPAFCDDVAPVDRSDLLYAVLERYRQSLDLLDTPEEIARRWEAAAGVPGKRYRIVKDGSALAFDAVALALATGGGLVVERGDGTRETIDLADARALR